MRVPLALVSWKTSSMFTASIASLSRRPFSAPPVAESIRHSSNSPSRSTSVDELKERLKKASLFKENAFIGGEWVQAAEGKTFDVS